MKFLFIAPDDVSFSALTRMVKHANKYVEKSLAGGHLRYPGIPTQFGVLRGRLSEMHLTGVDAIVAPGNSFGHMTGGFDGALVKLLGIDLDTKVRQMINDEYLGEMPVGSAEFVEMANRFIIYAPTMRVPKVLPKGTDVPYLATLAAMNVINKLNQFASDKDKPIKTVLIPLMGVGTGKVPHDVAAVQIYTACIRYLERINTDDLFSDGVEWDKCVADSWDMANMD